MCTIRFIASLFLVLILSSSLALACDPCSLYNASRLLGRNEGTFGVSVSEQYTTFDKAEGVQENARDTELVRGFSTTNFGFTYNPYQSLGFDLTIPLMGRRYDKIENFRVDTESDTDIGDIILSSTYTLIEYKRDKWTVIAEILGGLKLPSGDTGVLEEISTEEEGQENAFTKHHTVSNSSGGRALTFGSGSYDYIFGMNLLTRYERMLLLTNAQYTIRTEGDFDYEFGDDFLMSFTPGYYFCLDHDFTVAGAVSLAAEFKDQDKLQGERVSGSGVSNLYVGPAVLMTFGEHLGFETALDFRVTGEDANSTVVPETRLRTSLSYSF